MDAKTCDYCVREIVSTIPEKSAPGMCGGKSCNHRTVYGIFDEDCRQIIVNSSTAWGDATINME
jgi:hypothetical protein